MTRHPNRNCPRAGFTIVELLVVVTIIILMLVLILPTYETAVERAELTACQSNQKQIYNALLNYASDYYYRLPGTNWATNPHNDWSQWMTDTNGNRRIAPYTQVNGVENPGSKLWPYIQAEEVFVCPTFARLAVGVISDPRRKPANSYAMTENVWRGWWGEPHIQKLVHDPIVLKPYKRLLVADESPFTTAVARYRINNTWLGVSSQLWDPSHAVDGVATYHLPRDKKYATGNGNVLFFDGHVELTPQIEPNDSKRLAFPILWDNKAEKVQHVEEEYQ